MSVTQTNIITSASSTSSFLRVSVGGHNGVGAISAPGLKVGDVVVLFATTTVSDPSGTNHFPSDFVERTVSVDDQLQQTTAQNCTFMTFDALLLRGV